MPLPSDKVGDDVEDEECVAMLFDDGMMSINQQEWKETMKGDEELQKIRTFVNNGWPEKKQLIQASRCFWEVRDELSEEQGLFDGKVWHLSRLAKCKQASVVVNKRNYDWMDDVNGTQSDNKVGEMQEQRSEVESGQGNDGLRKESEKSGKIGSCAAHREKRAGPVAVPGPGGPAEACAAPIVGDPCSAGRPLGGEEETLGAIVLLGGYWRSLDPPQLVRPCVTTCCRCATRCVSQPSHSGPEM
ncbi:hypothetical protein NDU88_004432 [Pleurodeles waltl]|uniref:Uncharacterized protein n=1 Tax=Pleurodeles waltl TaxID=8319 RepID=A0AAV7QEW3_PLEWA|nr:hypothetical protein NDU88_004432 [Pleurodeles waltl]